MSAEPARIISVSRQNKMRLMAGFVTLVALAGFILGAIEASQFGAQARPLVSMTGGVLLFAFGVWGLLTASR